MTPTFAVLLFALVSCISAQVKWCAVKGPEKAKCDAMKNAFTRNNLTPGITCIEVMHESQCLRSIRQGEADVKSVGDRGIYTGGKFSSLRPVISETRGDTKAAFFYKSVIVLKKSSSIRNINDLKGKKSCHTGVMRTVGWVVPMGILFGKGGMVVKDCENSVKNVAGHFAQSCAPGAYTPYNNPDGDNPSKVCGACQDKTCPFSGEKYSSYNGAFRGVVDGVCDAAFVKETTVPTDAKGRFSYNEGDYQLLCPDGTRKAVSEWASCNWATRPHNAIVAKQDFASQPLKALLDRAVGLFGPGGSKTSRFQLFNSSTYGGRNLIFSDSSTGFNVTSAGDYRTYLGDGFFDSYDKFRPASCNKNFRWCTLSDAETRKCNEFMIAMGGSRITQDLTCVQGTSVDDCFTKIDNNQADLLTVSADQVYTGGRYKSMKPLSAELYDSGNDAATYYGVAVIKAGAKVNLQQLKGKKTCHTGYGRTVGWKVPIGYFAGRNDIKIAQAGCNVGQAAANFFGDMCTPGAREGNNAKSNPSKMCSLCPDDCQFRGKYGGYIQAVRCLKEKNADVAFVKHTTINDLLSTNPRPSWASGLNKNDFQLACPDGTVKSVDEWQSCTLARVPARAVVTSTKRDANTLQRHYQIALDRAQSRYKADNNTIFAMFNSEPNQSNLLFRDSTQALKRLDINMGYEQYIGAGYMNSMAALDPRRCTTAAASTVHVSLVTAILSLFVYLLC